MTIVPLAATLALLEKVAADNGFDRDAGRDGVWLAFASSQTPIRLWLSAADDAVCLAAFSMAHVVAGLDAFGQPLVTSMPVGAAGGRVVSGFPDLHQLVRTAFRLSRTLPDALLDRFTRETAGLPRATEVERLTVQRIGQDIFRNGLLEYWDGRCAVTGLAVPELLRASHIKPWAACETDAERLDVFNGLLLAPHVDAAFDLGFVSISPAGGLLYSERLSLADRECLGLHATFAARLTGRHQYYLEHHRRHVFGRREEETNGLPEVD